MEKQQAEKSTESRGESSQSPDTNSEDESYRPKVKKRTRITKKAIPDYRWTDEVDRKLADLIKEYPQLVH